MTVSTLSAVLLVAGCASVYALPPRQSSTHPSALAAPPGGYEKVHVPDVPLPDPTATDSVTLDAILAYADRHAPALQVARARVGLGDAAIVGEVPILPDNPTLSLGAGPGLNSGGNHVDITGSLSQRLEVAGERRLRTEAAERVRDRLEAELDEARWQVHRDVHAAFHRALVARERLLVAVRVLEFQDRLLEITRRRLAAGDVSGLAVRLAEGDRSQAEVAHIAATQDYLRARLELGAIGGWPASHPPEPAGILDPPRKPPDADTLLELARNHQPRLRTLQATHDETVARTRAADREAWPEPTIGVQVMRENFRFGPPETQMLGVLSVPIPVVRRNQGERATARAQESIADAERGSFGALLPSRIEQHRTAVAAAADRVAAYGAEILPKFEENLRLVQRAFELGEIDILQVTVARERFLGIQTDALAAYRDYFQAVAELEGAVGTDVWTEERLDHASPPEVSL
ncbi:MAG: TolC family protein [Nannocystaceae bacterium]|nr:TolC family protein [bacterium]